MKQGGVRFFAIAGLVTAVIAVGVFGAGAYQRIADTLHIDLLAPFHLLVGNDVIQHSLEQTEFAPAPLRVEGSAGGSMLSSQGILRETNKWRLEQRLEPLEMNEALSVAAGLKVSDMFARQYFAHISPTGAGPGDLIAESGYSYLVVGENLALGGFDDDADLVEAWMGSAGHRANILDDRYQEIGIAVMRGEYEGRIVWMAAQEFGLASSACDEPSADLAKEIASQRQLLQQMEAEVQLLRSHIGEQKRRSKEYVDAIKLYNARVSEYNEKVIMVKNLITEYNDQVESYNDCIY